MVKFYKSGRVDNQSTLAKQSHIMLGCLTDSQIVDAKLQPLLNVTPCLVFDVGADDDSEPVAEGLDAAVAVTEVVVEDARDEVAVLELDLTASLEFAAAVLASLEPETNEGQGYRIGIEAIWAHQKIASIE